MAGVPFPELPVILLQHAQCDLTTNQKYDLPVFFSRSSTTLNITVSNSSLAVTMVGHAGFAATAATVAWEYTWSGGNLKMLTVTSDTLHCTKLYSRPSQHCSRLEASTHKHFVTSCASDQSESASPSGT